MIHSMPRQRPGGHRYYTMSRDGGNARRAVCRVTLTPGPYREPANECLGLDRGGSRRQPDRQHRRHRRRRPAGPAYPGQQRSGADERAPERHLIARQLHRSDHPEPRPAGHLPSRPQELLEPEGPGPVPLLQPGAEGVLVLLDALPPAPHGQPGRAPVARRPGAPELLAAVRGRAPVVAGLRLEERRTGFPPLRGRGTGTARPYRTAPPMSASQARPAVIERWHRLVADRDMAALDALLADEV